MSWSSVSSLGQRRELVQHLEVGRADRQRLGLVGGELEDLEAVDLALARRCRLVGGRHLVLVDERRLGRRVEREGEAEVRCRGRRALSGVNAQARGSSTFSIVFRSITYCESMRAVELAFGDEGDLLADDHQVGRALVTEGVDVPADRQWRHRRRVERGVGCRVEVDGHRAGVRRSLVEVGGVLHQSRLGHLAPDERACDPTAPMAASTTPTVRRLTRSPRRPS